LLSITADIKSQQLSPAEIDDHAMADEISVTEMVSGNFTLGLYKGNGTEGDSDVFVSTGGEHGLMMIITVVLYGIICGSGTVGNTVVVGVIAHSCAMRSSVTNIYIINLAVSDFCFLAGLPPLIVTVLRQVR